MNKRNYQKELDKLIENVRKEGRTPKLFLHACCAPCSSYVMEYLSQYFEITIFFYNPNIAPEEEYAHRVAEIRRLIGEMEFTHPVSLVEGHYDPKEFYDMAKGLEDVPEGGERCFKCYRLRMEEAAKIARDGGYDYFTTTLSISPLKNARRRTVISVPLNYPMSTNYTGRTTADVFFQKEKPRSGTGRETQKMYKYENLCIFMKVWYTNTEKCRRIFA